MIPNLNRVYLREQEQGQEQGQHPCERDEPCRTNQCCGPACREDLRRRAWIGINEEVAALIELAKGMETQPLDAVDGLAREALQRIDNKIASETHGRWRDCIELLTEQWISNARAWMRQRLREIDRERQQNPEEHPLVLTPTLFRALWSGIVANWETDFNIEMDTFRSLVEQGLRRLFARDSRFINRRFESMADLEGQLDENYTKERERTREEIRQTEQARGSDLDLDEIESLLEGQPPCGVLADLINQMEAVALDIAPARRNRFEKLLQRARLRYRNLCEEHSGYYLSGERLNRLVRELENYIRTEIRTPFALEILRFSIFAELARTTWDETMERLDTLVGTVATPAEIASLYYIIDRGAEKAAGWKQEILSYQGTVAQQMELVALALAEDKCEAARTARQTIENAYTALSAEIKREESLRLPMKEAAEVERKWCSGISGLLAETCNRLEKQADALESRFLSLDCEKARSELNGLIEENREPQCKAVEEIIDRLQLQLQEKCVAEEEEEEEEEQTPSQQTESVSVSMLSSAPKLRFEEQGPEQVVYEIPQEEPCEKLRNILGRVFDDLQAGKLDHCRLLENARDKVESALEEQRALVDEGRCPQSSYVSGFAGQVLQGIEEREFDLGCRDLAICDKIEDIMDDVENDLDTGQLDTCAKLRNAYQRMIDAEAERAALEENGDCQPDMTEGGPLRARWNALMARIEALADEMDCAL